MLFTGLLLLPQLSIGQNNTNKNRTILIVGDSLSAAFSIDRSASWVALLQNRLDSKGYAFKIVNASISGDTTQSGVSRLPFLLSSHQPDIVVIALGGNDGLRGLPLDLSKSNLQQMIQLTQNKQSQVVLCGVRLPPNLGPVYNRMFQSMYADLAKRNKVAYVKALLKNVSDNPALMQSDGIHPTEKGQPLILENVWKILQPLLLTYSKQTQDFSAASSSKLLA